jgi:hypothetical protein
MQLNEMTIAQLEEIIETNDTAHGTMYVEDNVQFDFDIKYSDDAMALIYNGKEYDCFSDVVCENEEVANAYHAALIELIENANWNN